MACNKENYKRSILKSKIPLPMEPLPGISKDLLKKDSEIERRPLKTLLDQSSNLPVQSIKEEIKKRKQNKYKLRKSKSLTPNSRYVTVRTTNNNLDWSFKVFKDEANNSVICISDDDDIANSSEHIEYFDKNCSRNCLGRREIKKIVTPAALGPNHAKNIKKSLKRPHSKELQGQPSSERDLGEEGNYRRRLKFNEKSQDLVKSPEHFKNIYAHCFARDYGVKTYLYLVAKENKWPKHSITPNATRACILNWLFKVNGGAGNPATIHTATWYLDSVLAMGPVPIDKLQLFATACFWIAQKIHGPATIASKLVKCSNHAFTCPYLMKAEAHILKALKLPPQPVLPQEFVTYLAWWCDSEDPEIEPAATFICMCGLILDMGLLDEYPSVVGTAAVRNALILLRKHDLLEKLEMCPVFEDIEQKSNLYNACAIQRKALLMLLSPLFEYKAPLELYNTAPYNIPAKILQEAKYLSVVDNRTKINYIPKNNKIFQS